MTRIEMLEQMCRLQNELNTKLDQNWKQRDDFRFLLAAKVEAAEAAEHLHYKWWKDGKSDMNQFRLELVDIWHFLLSEWLRERSPSTSNLYRLEESFICMVCSPKPIIKLLENLLDAKGLNNMLEAFCILCHAVGMDIKKLHSLYVGKQVLNQFRWANGYADGTYIKIWGNREDNEHLYEILESMTHFDEERLQTLLSERYQQYAN